MFKLVLLLTLVLIVTCFKLQLANLASILGSESQGSNHIRLLINRSVVNSQPEQVTTNLPEITSRVNSIPTPSSQVTTTPSMTSTNEPRATAKPKQTASTTNADDEVNHQDATISTNGPASNETVTTTTTTTTTIAPDPTSLPSPPPPGPDLTNPNKPNANKPSHDSGGRKEASAELSILVYSVFIVYVSIVKLIYHNIHLINHNLTEQGILMIFGIIWQLVARKLSPDHSAFPRFNSRIFFYLFLPSTVLESASLLSNKWLFFNLLPILTHSIIGTVLYTSSMGLTIYSLVRPNVFVQNLFGSSSGSDQQNSGAFVKLEQLQHQQLSSNGNELSLTTFVDPSGITGNSGNQNNDITLAECLIFGTILSSIDSAPMLTVFKQYQVNEKLYYLVLGENLMNNAVVITIFNSLIELFETTKLTVFRIYLATLQFFANLVGAVFIGFVLALFALISVRLTKRCQLPNILLSYQNQCQAMVETLLILKLAYLTYTLANIAGTSSIVGLATFGILNDQYIKHNLNLRSQLAFRQVILGMKTMGYSLVYPLLGMMLVDTALTQYKVLETTSSNSAHSTSAPSVVISSAGASLLEHSKQTKVAQTIPSSVFSAFIGNLQERHSQANGVFSLPSPTAKWNTSYLLADEREFMLVADGADKTVAYSSMATGNLSQLASQANLNWYVKFLSIVILLTIVYRFLIVITLGLIGNVLTCGQLKIKFKEQLLMAYGGFKGPLSMALMHSLMEHDNHRERNTRNKHLFKYTVLMNIFISAVLSGTFIRPLVARIQTTLIGRVSTNLEDAANSTIVFDQVNYKLSEYVSHGLNSILGHSRSPYEKFIEFNETHIKPWLVRGGSNTNWLSVFYDNLILDETLNANCFHIATEDPTTMRAFRNANGNRRQQRRSRGVKKLGQAGTDRWWRRRSSSVSFLDTIDEMPRSSAHSQAASDLSQPPADVPIKPRKSSAGVSIISANSNKNRVGQGPPNDQDALKEFVMFNLKMDSAKRRREAQRRRFAAGQSESPEPNPVNQPRFMIDNSSSNLSDSSLDRASRRGHLNELEARLAKSGVPTTRGATVGHRVQDGNQTPRASKFRSRHGGGTFDRGAGVTQPDPGRPPSINGVH
jgi:NhaP-type Na+/H+ or K+/H+ antiporter